MAGESVGSYFTGADGQPKYRLAYNLAVGASDPRYMQGGGPAEPYSPPGPYSGEPYADGQEEPQAPYTPPSGERARTEYYAPRTVGIGGTSSGTTSGAYGGAGGYNAGANWGSAAEEELRRQRELMFGTLSQGANMWQGGLGDQLRSNLSQGMSGAGPFTEQVQARLFSQQADGLAAAEAQRMAMIRRQMANSGMAGGGGELAMNLQSGLQRAQGMNAAQADIGMNAALQNFGAQERARDATTNYFSARSAAEAPYRLAEANARGRFEVTGTGAPSAPLFSLQATNYPYMQR